MAFRCGSCNGSVLFDIESQKMKCQHCGSEFEPEEFRVRDTGQETEGSEAGLATFTCGSCGAELESTEDSVVGFCPYCGGQSMLQSKTAGKPIERIISFQITREQCGERYRDFARKVPYLPRELRKPEFLQSFTGIYMPYYKYDVRMGRSRIRGTKTVKKTSRYDVINTYRVEASTEGEYRGVPFDASRYLDDEIAAQTLPYDPTTERPFHPAYLSGFYADASTVPAELYERDAEAQASKDMVDEVAAAIYQREKISVEKEKSSVEAHTTGHHSVLFPMWFLTWRKENRVAYAVLNGVSGTVVSDLPVDMLRFSLGCAGIALVLFLALELLFQPTPRLTSVLSFLAALVMAVLVRRGAQQVYDRRTHARDKGWRAGEDGGTEKPEPKSFLGKNSAYILLGAGIAVYFLLMNGGSVGLLSALLGAAALLVTLYQTKEVYGLQRAIEIKYPLVSMVLLLISVALNLAVVLISPVQDYWYYVGDAVCIVMLVLASVGMIRTYNVGTTRPLPRLFDRNEV